jgi:hypothetical protein
MRNILSSIVKSTPLRLRINANQLPVLQFEPIATPSNRMTCQTSDPHYNGNEVPDWQKP